MYECGGEMPQLQSKNQMDMGVWLTILFGLVLLFGFVLMLIDTVL
jgi:hypothetical protein